MPASFSGAIPSWGARFAGRLRNGGPPRLLVILGGSGAGKSSYLRVGLIPRLARDHENFFPLR